VTTPAIPRRSGHSWSGHSWQAGLRNLWLVCAAIVAAVGASAALSSPGPLVTFVVAGMLGLVAGGFTFAFGPEDMTGVIRGATVAGWISALTVVSIGLGRLFGFSSALILGAVILTSPLVPATVRWYRGRRAERDAEREKTGEKPAAAEVVPAVATPVVMGDDTTGDLDMTDFELALVDTEEAPDPEPGETTLAGLDLDDLCRLWRRASVLLRQPLDPRRLTEVLEARQQCLDELMRRHPAATRAWLDAPSHADDPRPFLEQST
jgi:hypothetical protein